EEERRKAVALPGLHSPPEARSRRNHGWARVAASDPRYAGGAERDAMTILGTVRRPNGTALNTENAMGTAKLELVGHVPGSGQYKFEFVPPFRSIPAVT